CGDLLHAPVLSPLLHQHRITVTDTHEPGSLIERDARNVVVIAHFSRANNGQTNRSVGDLHCHGFPLACFASWSLGVLAAVVRSDECPRSVGSILKSTAPGLGGKIFNY